MKYSKSLIDYHKESKTNSRGVYGNYPNVDHGNRSSFPNIANLLNVKRRLVLKQ